jgi:hypothetical protein
MDTDSSLLFPYQLGGALKFNHPTYVTRDADGELYEALKRGDFCYVLNSRQTGKSSLKVQTLHKLRKEKIACADIDLTNCIEAETSAEQFYRDLIAELIGSLTDSGIELEVNRRNWWKEHDDLSPVHRLGAFIQQVLLKQIHQNLVIFVDEIDYVLGLNFRSDFFALIRSFYNSRPTQSDYNRLTFVLLGVATPSELIRDEKRTPFNIGRGIELKGFQAHEVAPLGEGLRGIVKHPQSAMEEILSWTGGQPYLTQKVCNLVTQAGQETPDIAQLLQQYIIDNWEAQDEQQHLKTIRNRLLRNEQKAGYLLELYRQILQQGGIEASQSSEEVDLRLSGLVVKEGGKLRVYNPIYAAVFDELWIDTTLKKLRPYAENFRAWIASGKTEDSLLLRGNTLTESEKWAKDNNFFSGEDQEFLVASRIQEQEEEIAKKEREATKKANQVLRRLTSIGGVILAVALIVAGYFGWEAKKQNDILTAVRSLSQFAGELRKKGEIEASDEALRKAGLSTLIENEELKQAWLFAATAEAYQSLGYLGYPAAQYTVKQSLNYLNKISKAQLDPRIFNQVSAFAYFMDGQLNNDNEQDYRTAYNALKDSEFDPYNPKTETDILNEKSVELIHYQLIKPANKSANIGINSSDKIAISFRQHLYKELEFLLKEDRLKEADQKTTEIMLYIAQKKEDGWFNVESLKNFSCPALKEIDKLWYNYPKRKRYFGFRVQKEIWQNNGSPTWNSLDEIRWRKFYIDVGWKTEESGVDSWDKGIVYKKDLRGFNDLKNTPRGNLPWGWGWGGEEGVALGVKLLFSRITNCNL